MFLCVTAAERNQPVTLLSTSSLTVFDQFYILLLLLEEKTRTADSIQPHTLITVVIRSLSGSLLPCPISVKTTAAT